LFLPHFKLGILPVVLISLMYLAFITHTAGLAARWYVSGHAPWSNGFEVLIYLAWTTILAGLVLSVRSEFTMAVTPILSFLILQIAHLSWMDPQITNLVPVLKSFWLVLHVSVITSSYGFLAMGALIALVNLILMCTITKRNISQVYIHIEELSAIIEISLTAGLYLLSVGTFLGGVWANESWGRYWGWDPKETWALITILVYAFILHMRLIPGLKGIYALNLGALTGIGSVLMTFFGVNYYLTGLHSYASGDPLQFPLYLYILLVIVVGIAGYAYYSYRRYRLLQPLSDNKS